MKNQIFINQLRAGDRFSFQKENCELEFLFNQENSSYRSTIWYVNHENQEINFASLTFETKVNLIKRNDTNAISKHRTRLKAGDKIYMPFTALHNKQIKEVYQNGGSTTVLFPNNNQWTFESVYDKRKTNPVFFSVQK